MRRPPDVPVPQDLLAGSRQKRTLFDLDIRTVTPMFGGSDVAGQVDPLRPISAKSIRGHLRFWWRACRAGDFSSPAEVFAAEERIWGSTDAPSAVDVVVTILSQGKQVKCAEFRLNQQTGRFRSVPDFRPGYPPYAIFPFQGQLAKGGRSIEKEPAVALEDVRFHLVLSLAGHVAEADTEHVRAAVLDSVWAWLIFGGVGARTRRGCGALWCEQWPFASLSPDPARAIEAGSAEHVSKKQRTVAAPALKNAMLVVGPKDQTPMECWREAVTLMQFFRQGLGYGRSGTDPSHPGRSRWPEPDSIRDLCGAHAVGHDAQHAARPYYPRADLGLPIIFHFKDSDDPPANGRSDPMLEGAEKGRSRMASPIIVKPLALNSSSARTLVVALDAPHVWDQDAPGVTILGEKLQRVNLDDEGKSARVAPISAQKVKAARVAFCNFAVHRLNGKGVRL